MGEKMIDLGVEKKLGSDTVKHIYIGLMVMALLISNIIAMRMIHVGELFGLEIYVTGAVFTYFICFLMTDILSEKFGKKVAKDAIKAGVVAQLIAFALIMIVVFVVPVGPTDWDVDMLAAYKMIFTVNGFIIAGSITAFYISQNLDVKIFHVLRHKFRDKKWVRSSSTILSQLVDTLIMTFIAFVIPMWLGLEGSLPFIILLGMLAGEYMLKVALAALDTPIFYLLTGGRRTQENFDDANKQIEETKNG